MKRKNDELSSELKCIREELDHANKEKEETKVQIDEEKVMKEKMREELNHAKEEKEKMRVKLEEKLKQMKNKYEESKCEKEQIKQELKISNEKLKEKLNEEKQKVQTIIVGGYYGCNQLGEKPNNKSIYNSFAISPPTNSSLCSISLLSY